MAITGYTKTVKQYIKDKNKKWEVKKEHLDLLLKDYLKIQMDQYLETTGDEYERFTVNEGEKSTGYKHILKVELPTVEGFCCMYDYAVSTVVDWQREDGGISLTFKKLMKKQAKMIQDGAISGRYNPIISKMLLNVNHGYKEVTTTNNTNIDYQTEDSDEFNDILKNNGLM